MSAVDVDRLIEEVVDEIIAEERFLAAARAWFSRRIPEYRRRFRKAP